MNFTPEMNDGRNVFVFGSNESGYHGGGAAREAHQHWGAQMHCGFGRTGNSFAIPTMDFQINKLPLSVIAHYVARFIVFAGLNPKQKFLVTKIGCGIAGYTEEEIKTLFSNAPKNCVLPEGW